MEKLKKYILTVGQANFSRQTGFSIALINHWVRGRHLPGPKACKTIEEKTGGAIKREEIRPEYFGKVA